MKRARKVISIILAQIMLLALAACGGKAAETEPPADQEKSTWEPEQTVEMIVPFSAGGASDLLARAVESVWSKYCDQPLLITNMPGGGGVTGAMAVVAAEPDGYTIELGYGSGHDTSMMYLQELEYDPFTMLEPVCCLTVNTVAVVAPIDSEFDTMADVAEWAKEHPDTPVTAAVGTANGTVDLTFQAISQQTGINMSIVPHDGGAAIMTDILSGSYMIGGGHPAEVYTYVESGQMKVLGIASAERDQSFPDVPTLQEQGIDFVSYGSIKGIAVPVGTPQEIKEYYEDIFAQICEDAEFQETLLNMAQPAMYMDTEEFTKYFEEANADNKNVIEDLGLAYYQ